MHFDQQSVLLRVGLHDHNMLRLFLNRNCYMLRMYEKYVTVFVTIFSKNGHIFRSRRKILGFCVYSFKIAQFLAGGISKQLTTKCDRKMMYLQKLLLKVMKMAYKLTANINVKLIILLSCIPRAFGMLTKRFCIFNRHCSARLISGH